MLSYTPDRVCLSHWTIYVSMSLCSTPYSCPVREEQGQSVWITSTIINDDALLMTGCYAEPTSYNQLHQCHERY